MIKQMRFINAHHDKFYLKAFFKGEKLIDIAKSEIIWTRFKGDPDEEKIKFTFKVEKKLPYGWYKDSYEEFQKMVNSQGWMMLLP